jgi:hypothetical protein
MDLRYRSSKDSCFVALVLVLLAQDFLEHLHVEALSLGLCLDFLLPLIQRLDLFVYVLNSVDKGANAIASIPAMSVMRAHPLQGAYSYAPKVTERLNTHDANPACEDDLTPPAVSAR